MQHHPLVRALSRVRVAGHPASSLADRKRWPNWRTARTSHADQFAPWPRVVEGDVYRPARAIPRRIRGLRSTLEQGCIGRAETPLTAIARLRTWSPDAWREEPHGRILGGRLDRNRRGATRWDKDRDGPTTSWQPRQRQSSAKPVMSRNAQMCSGREPWPRSGRGVWQPSPKGAAFCAPGKARKSQRLVKVVNGVFTRPGVTTSLDRSCTAPVARGPAPTAPRSHRSRESAGRQSASSVSASIPMVTTTRGALSPIHLN